MISASSTERVVHEAAVVPQPERPVLPGVLGKRQVALGVLDGESSDVLSSLHVVIEARNAHAQPVGDRPDRGMLEADLECGDCDGLPIDPGWTARGLPS